jgi:Domain of unknown function (DUF1707)
MPSSPQPGSRPGPVPWCWSAPARLVPAIIARVTEPVRPEDLRVSDAERRETQQRLHRAHDAGQLDLTEFDERLKAVWAARTRGELDTTTVDLPDVPAPAPQPGRAPVFADTGGGTAMRVLTIIWASIVAVNLVVWGIVSVTDAELIYPWFLWVAGPPGAVLAVLYAAGIGRPRR